MKQTGINPLLSRRHFIKYSSLLVGTGSLLQDSRANESLISPTQKRTDPPFIAMIEDGPLYPPVEIPWNKDLTSIGKGKAQGKVLYLFGTIFSRNGSPLPNTEVQIWQTDINGNYKHPRGWRQDELDPHFGYFAQVKTDSNGFYIFKTIQPRWYLLPPIGARQTPIHRSAHIHMKMKHIDHGILTTEAYFDNASHHKVAPKDPVFQSRSAEARSVIVLKEQSPADFMSLEDFEPGAICCRYDLAFLL